MNTDFAAAMRRALKQTRAGNPLDATRNLQAALGKVSGDERARRATPATTAESRHGTGSDRTPRRSLRDVVDSLSSNRSRIKAFERSGMRGASAPPPVPKGARYETRAYSCPAGARDYRLYVPAARPDGPQGLVLMLHGCTQNPDDFARGTAMNAQAERHGLILAYPAQTQAENPSACWNWFRPGDQRRGAGEPAILAGLAGDLVSEFRVKHSHVFVAGLSAGGAMAAVMGETYPELFAAVGVHSGLPYGSASDVVSAFAVMRGEANGAGHADRRRGKSRMNRTIVFQGTADATVNSSNAARIIEGTSAMGGSELRREGRVPGGRGYMRTVTLAPDGKPLTELWMVEGAGHAWSGGSASGSFTDPTGPDASAEMVRFFLDAG